MADLKISQLTEASAAVAGDYLIINKGDATTQKIDASDLLSVSGFTPTIKAFFVDESNSVKTGSDNSSPNFPNQGWGMIGDRAMFVRYNANPAESGSLKDVLLSFEETHVMPKGANRAMLMYQTSVGYNSRDVEGDGTGKRFLATKHLVKVTGTNSNVSFYNGDNDTEDVDAYGISLQKTFELYTGNISQWDFQRDQMFVSKYTTIVFNEGEEVKFQSKMQIKKGGRGYFRAHAGTLIIIPFYDDGSGSTTRAMERAAGAFDVSEPDAPLMTSAQLADLDASNLRTWYRHALAAIQSRLTYPPTTTSDGSAPATQQEYEDLIIMIWDALESPNFDTYEKAAAEYEAFRAEAIKPKYAISPLLAFQDPSSQRQLL